MESGLKNNQFCLEMMNKIRLLIILFLSLYSTNICFGEKISATDKISCDQDGMLVINGKRTFIIGSYYLPKTTAPFKELSVNGYNYIHVNADQQQLDSAQNNGLKTWLSTGSIKNNDPKDIARITDLVTKFRNHPSLLFWEMEDEPAFTWNSAEPRIKPEPLIETYRLIKQNDPEHLIITNQGPVNLISTLQKYNSSTDVLACDIYPVIPAGIKPDYALHPDGLQGDLLNTSISQVGEYADKMKKVSNDTKPVFMVLQGFSWEMLKPEAQRDKLMIKYPTYEESRFMAFDAIVHGATGIIYWGTDFTPQPSSFISDLNRVTKELAGLQEVISAKTEKLTLETEYHELGYSVDAGVEIIAKRVHGKLFMITVNSDKNPVKITFSNLKNHKSVRVISENRIIDLTNGKLTDNYKPFEVHIYELMK